jgi:superfamily II DNA or RNA helicase
MDSNYVDLHINGKLFPLWIMKHFKKYKLPPIISKPNEDPCSIKQKVELHKYQQFIGDYLSFDSPYNEVLLYHGMGSGKTVTAINVINILYNADPNLNIVILIKASLRNDPWMRDLKDWLYRENNEANLDITKVKSYKNIHFVHYDSPFADRDFMDIIKKLDTTKRTMYIFEEVHNFIRNVYSNINSATGKRAQIIYDYIVTEKKENSSTKIILMSATPVINVPFELALLFNILRPGIFPTSEVEFEQLYVSKSTYPILNPTMKNIFQRRILGLVSYYIGATPDLYAAQKLHLVDLEMSEYHYEIYQFFEEIEEAIEKKARRFKGKSTTKLYRSYTRQACNVVFPPINDKVSGELRPRPNKFRITDRTADDIEKGRMDKVDKLSIDIEKYLEVLKMFITSFQKFFQNITDEDKKNGNPITNDLELFKKVYETDFDNFNRDHGKAFYLFCKNQCKSKLAHQMYEYSPKMTCISFLSYISPGPVLIYSNYVYMEGLEIMKIYLNQVGFGDYMRQNKEDYFSYGEFHGAVTKEDRDHLREAFNNKSNIRGKDVKIFLLSPSGSEGISLRNIRQEHILEPYWTEVRITQIIGRGIRQCYHEDLPMSERVVHVYRYKVLKPGNKLKDATVKITTDEIIEDLARSKDNLNQSFLTPIKEAAFDCELFKNHNMMTQTYNCFKFTEKSLFTKHVGPAYKDDIKDDVKYNDGLNAENTVVQRIKVIKIKIVTVVEKNGNDIKYSEPETHWYNPKTGIVYDIDLHYPIGKILFDKDNLPEKLNKEIYIMSDKILIP